MLIHRVWASAIVGFLASSAPAQVFFHGLDAVGSPGLNGPSALTAQGWEFRAVLDSGLTQSPWDQGPWHAGQPAPWQGSGYLTGGISAPPAVTKSYVQWIILPPLAGQAAGQILSAHVRGFTSEFPIAGSVQLRYSPSGGVSTGSTISSLGDFTVQLDANSNGTLTAWDELQGIVPGSGRLAIRWIGSISTGFASGTALDLFVDEVSLDSAAQTPVLPQPGETVHWTTAMSPIHLVNQQVIPANATLIIDAGVQIFFDFNTPLFTGSEMTALGGHIRFEGTPASPVILRRGTNTTQVPSIGVGSGLLQTVGTAGSIFAANVNADISFGAGQSASLTIRDSTFWRAAPIDWNSPTDPLYQVPRVSASRATITIDTCTFQNAITAIGDAVFKVAGCTFDNSQLQVVRFPIAQTANIDGNIFRNSTMVAPIELDGYDAHLGPGNTIVNNFAPLSLRGGGLTPDSAIPATGNSNNRILFTGSTQGEIVGPMNLPPMSIPYRMWSGFTIGQQFDARVNFLPGATIEMDPGTYISSLGGARAEVRGTPESPVRFIPSVVGQRWITFQTSNNPPLIVRNGIFDGADFGVGGVDTLFTVHDCTFTSNGEGVRSGDYCGAYVSKSRFINNQFGTHSIWGGTQGAGAEGVVIEYGPSNPNAFEGNGQGVVVDPPYANPSSMLHAWWNSPSGPTSPANPAGTGQSASTAVAVLPFRSSPVNFDDHPPVVRVKQVAHSRRLRVGTKIILHWDARDDGSIVSQRLANLPVNGFRDPVTVIPNIPPNARSVELNITDDGQAGQVFRIISVDNSGQEGFDDFHLTIGEDGPLALQYLTNLSGGYRVGENFTVETTLLGTPDSVELHIDDLLHDLQPRGTLGLDAGFNTMPAVSTDLARYAVILFGEPHYSPYFSIRPQAGFGDQPPEVSMTSPTAGAAYPGGGIVPVRWIAADDHGLRSFDLHASYDGGESWHLFASDLPGSTRAYDWQLPASTGFADVRVRVIARDSCFQVTSDGTHRVLSITPGTWPVACYANCDGSTTAPLLTANDFQCFLNKYAAGDAYANCDQSTATPLLTANDFQCFLNKFAVGCP